VVKLDNRVKVLTAEAEAAKLRETRMKKAKEEQEALATHWRNRSIAEQAANEQLLGFNAQFK
ncbi:unnamed protein product, partial [Effrenium voratum]